MTSHLSPADLDRYLGGSMDDDTTAGVERHVSACVHCRAMVDDRVVAAARGIGAEVDGEQGGHPEFEEMAAYVDGNAAQDDAAAIEAHLALCEACDAECRALAEERDRIRGLRPAGLGRVPYAPMAAAAALALAAMGVWWVTQGRTPPVEPAGSSTATVAAGGAAAIELLDGGRTIRVPEDGHVTGLSTLGDVDREAVAAAVLSARLPVRVDLAALSAAPGQLMGSAAARSAPLSPAGIVVETDRPVFSWPAVPNATTYVIGVFDSALGPVVESPPVAGPTWTPGEPLPRGATYQWQVTATTSSGPVVLPSPTAPVATFRVLDAAGAESVLAARRSGSRLALGILAARAGLLADAERELAALAAENPGSALAASLLTQVRAARR